jgi:hypothetical protein
MPIVRSNHGDLAAFALVTSSETRLVAVVIGRNVS